MTERAYEGVIEALQRRIGGRLEGSRDEGLAEMSRVIIDAFGYDAGSAEALIKELTRSGQLRYVARGGEQRQGGMVAVPPPVVAAPGTSTVGGPPIVPMPVEAGEAAGYWEIGVADMTDDPIGTRKGQVRPPE